MRITIPDLPQLAQTRTSRPTSLAVDTRGLQTLAATTEAAFRAASNAANEFWKLELQEDENVQLAAAVTKYGNGLDDASDAAAKAPPTQARSVFEAAAAEAPQTYVVALRINRRCCDLTRTPLENTQQAQRKTGSWRGRACLKKRYFAH